MQVAVIQDNSDVPAGTIADWLVTQRGATLTTVPAEELEAHRDALFAADLVIALGAREAAYDTFPWVLAQRRLLTALAEQNHAVIGICFGAQLLSSALGGYVGRLPSGFHGFVENDRVFNPRFAGAWLRWHGDFFTLPPGGELLSRSGDVVTGFRYRRAIGLQFHPEACREGLAAWIERAPAENLPDMDHAAFLEELCARLEVIAPARDALYTELLRLTA